MANKMNRKTLILSSVTVAVILILSSSTAYGNIFTYEMFPNMGSMSNTQSNNNYEGMMGGMMNGNYMSSNSAKGFDMSCSTDREHIDDNMMFGDHNIIIENYEFHPQDLTVEVGTTVTWINMDIVGHNVESGTHE